MNKILLVGAGPMAIAYAKVLQALEAEVTVVGRGVKSAEVFYEQTNIQPLQGGLKQVMDQLKKSTFSHAIIAVGVEELASATNMMLELNIPKVLVEKPAALNFEELARLNENVKAASGEVYIAYNRRFYGSVQRLMKLIEEDGGATSVQFEFTEWAHRIEPFQKAPGVKENWFLANSTHVVDLAFYLAGKPTEMCSYTAGSLSWHPVSIFSGAGVTDRNVVFSYSANWESAGRWQVALSTRSGTYHLSPLEELSFQKKGTLTREPVALDNEVDVTYKPGLYNLVDSFLSGEKHNTICTMEEHMQNAGFYQKILAGNGK
jgi:predicted dehydrogenase